MGLQKLFEDYRNWAKTQEWKNKKQDERLFGGDPVLQEEFEKWSGGFSPSNLGGGLSGMAGIFAGAKSSKADLAALTKARQLEKQGTSAENIWRETGWFKAPWDEQWRYEISDKEMRPLQTVWRRPFDDPEIQQSYMGEAYEHPELYAAHKDIADIPLYTNPTISGKAEYTPEALWNDEDIGVKINRPDEIIKTRRYLAEMREPAHSNFWRKQLEGEGLQDDPIAKREMINYMQRMKRGLSEMQSGYIWNLGDEHKVRSSILHELQHAIQNREGFARGGSPEEFLEKGVINPSTGLPYSQKEAKEMYKRIGGEFEARLTQKRMGYSPLARRYMYPLAEPDVPLEEVFSPKGLATLIKK